MINADERLLYPTDEIKVPSKYLEYVITNYENGYIPYSSLSKTLALVGINSEVFKKEDTKENKELDMDDVFEEFER